MKAAILSVGTELLLGDIVNTNAAFLSQQLAELGIGCYKQVTVGDNQQRLAEAVQKLMQEVDILLITGGLGPTSDDLTKETIANMYQKCMILHEPSLLNMQKVFKEQSKEMPGINLKQAMMPANTVVFQNDQGTAAGLAMTVEGTKEIIMMPGPPREMEPMFRDKIKQYLASFSEETFVSETIHLFGIGESNAVSMLETTILEQENPTVAPYAKQGEMFFRITARAHDTDAAKNLLAPTRTRLLEQFQEYVYGINAGSLEQVLMAKLVAARIPVKITEYGTGSSVAFRLAQVDDPTAPVLQKATAEANLPNDVDNPLIYLESIVGTHADILEISAFYNHEQATSYNPGTIYYCISYGGKTLTRELSLKRNYKNDNARMRNLSASHIFNEILKSTLIK